MRWTLRTVSDSVIFTATFHNDNSISTVFAQAAIAIFSDGIGMTAVAAFLLSQCLLV